MNRSRSLTTVLLAAAALLTFSAPAQAVEHRPTTIAGGRPGLFGLNVIMTPHAKLTDTATGEPIVGATVEFSAEAPSGYNLPVCSAVTNSKGLASCGGVKAVLAIMQSPNQEYMAYFPGMQIGEVSYNQSFDRVRFLRR